MEIDNPAGMQPVDLLFNGSGRNHCWLKRVQITRIQALAAILFQPACSSLPGTPIAAIRSGHADSR
jgi:hypothetical protein